MTTRTSGLEVAEPSAVDAENAELFRTVARASRKRIREGRRFRRNLPEGGRLHIDRRLPFLLLHRARPDVDDPGTRTLVVPSSAHLISPGDPALAACVADLVRVVAQETARSLDAFLLVELWAGERPEHEEEEVQPVPRLRLRYPGPPPAWMGELVKALEEIRLRPDRGGAMGVAREELEVEVVAPGDPHPPGLPPLLEDDRGGAYHRLGLELEPFYRSPDGRLYPRIIEVLQRALTEALYRGIFAFSSDETCLDAPHHRALGRQSVSRAARHVDTRLGEVASSFDLLLQVTPVNGEEAWTAFRDGGRDREPDFQYRPLSFDPERLKSRLFDVPVHHVEDPLLAYLFREKQEELDREVSLLRDRDTPGFLPGSLQLYGGVDDELHETALRILRRLPPRGLRDDREEYGEEDADDSPGFVGAEGFALRARSEIDHYRERSEEFDAKVEIRKGIAAGLMVSGGTLLVSRNLRVPRNRVEALIQHEVGTHLLTWVNGRRQPFGQFAAGLAGYDPLQEGLAVLAEYLVGGLTGSRMRILAGRVVAVRARVDGARFVDTFRLLADEHGFPGRSAFMVALRVHRGGGMTKDAAYLRGLVEVLAYLRGGGSLDPLWVGKLGLPHLEVVQELMLRGILRLPAVRPRYSDDDRATELLDACRRKTVMDLVEECCT